jgi:uncharacterized iron-regulated membrane protein
MRRYLVLVHRWLGLCTAVFLLIAGLTGAIISWDKELDRWLNPALYEAKSASAVGARTTLELADQFERADPRVRVGYVPLSVPSGSALGIFVDPRRDPATGKAFELGFNQVALDPATGEVQAKRMWGQVSASRENLLPFLYKLHYSLHIPSGFGVELGTLLMGIVAMGWVIDCFVSLWISFPSWKSWRKSFAFRLREGGYRLNFDLHRSGGVWVWGLLLTMAVTAVYMNLQREVVRPIVALFSPLTPSPFTSRTPSPAEQPIEPKVSREHVLDRARVEGERLGLGAPAGGITYSPDYGFYGVGFFEPGDELGDGLGNAWLYFDGQDGKPVGAEIPGKGSAGDILLQAQFPLHSGRILGLTGRILVSLLGLVVAMLSVTGIVIWAQKRRARHWQAQGKESLRDFMTTPTASRTSEIPRAPVVR